MYRSSISYFPFFNPVYFLDIYVLKVGSYVNAYKQINLARTLVVSRLHFVLPNVLLER